MSKKSDEKCPVTTVLDLATDTAKANLGTDGANRRSAAKATLETAVTENDTTNAQKVDATVSLGVASSSGPAAGECCCLSPKGCCCAAAAKPATKKSGS